MNHSLEDRRITLIALDKRLALALYETVQRKAEIAAPH
jgi:hypothetical protein